MEPHNESVSARTIRWLRRSRIELLFLAGFIMAMAAISGMGGVYAWLSSRSQVDNLVNTPLMETSIVEGNTPTDTDGWDPQPVNWGGQTSKYVSFSNTGQASVLIRVALTQTWTKTTGEVTSYLSNVAPGTAEPTPIASPHWTPEGLDEGTLWWYNVADGWYYYRKVLAPGETIGPVLDYVSFTAMPEGYAAADYKLRFQVEAVQYSMRSDNENLQSAEETFGVTYTETDGLLTWTNP